jgi:hypothetical protein
MIDNYCYSKDNIDDVNDTNLKKTKQNDDAYANHLPGTRSKFRAF